MNKKQHYRTVFISDIHLGNLKNQGDKLVKFLDSIVFKNLIIVGDFIDYWQIKWFGKRREKEEKILNYVNDLSKKGVKVTYIQGNHDRELRCGKQIHIENMTIIRNMYYYTLKNKKYYVTHGDNIDGINRDGNKIGQLGSICFGLMLRLESIWNKNVFKYSCFSIAEKIEERIKKVRMPDSKVKKRIKKVSQNIDCDGFIIGHLHTARHYNINGLDYFNTGDWISNCSAVVEDEKGNLKLLECIS